MCTWPSPIQSPSSTRDLPSPPQARFLVSLDPYTRQRGAGCIPSGHPSAPEKPANKVVFLFTPFPRDFLCAKGHLLVAGSAQAAGRGSPSHSCRLTGLTSTASSLRRASWSLPPYSWAFFVLRQNTAFLPGR